MYQEQDLDLLRTIRQMLHERGYTIAGARQRLAADRRRAASEREQIELDFLAPKERRRLREIRDELAALLGQLRGNPRGRDRRGRPAMDETARAPEDGRSASEAGREDASEVGSTGRTAESAPGSSNAESAPAARSAAPEGAWTRPPAAADISVDPPWAAG